ncbi:MAG: ABC transporter substrate-binding protein [Candidatus Caldatribacteriota bacterium]|nr:ABC transporter substrate-binding protein [Candidatus Caldatribacteriota bacterium]
MLKKVFLILTVSILLFMWLSGSIFADSGSGKNLRKITVLLDWIPNTNHTGLYAAEEKGYYVEEGLSVDIIQPSEGGSAALIAAGQAEFGISYQEQVTYARTSKEPLPVKAIAAIIQHNTSGFASPVEKGIESPKDFEGKKYGGWGSPMEKAMIKALMEKDGADFSKTEIINIGAIDFFTSVKKYVDYTWIYYGWDGVAAKLKNFPINFILLQDFDSKLDFYTPVIIASENLINNEPDLVRRFLKATTKGYGFCMEKPEEAVKALLKNAPETDKEIAIASQKYLASQFQADAERWGEMEKEIWYNYSHWMYEKKLIEQELDVDEAFTNEFLPEK